MKSPSCFVFVACILFLAEDTSAGTDAVLHIDKKTIFSGNQNVSDEQLRNLLKATNEVSSNESDAKQTKKRVDRITTHYRNNGFFDAKVGVGMIAEKDGTSAIEFRIDEGQRYRFGKITVRMTGNGQGNVSENTKLKSGEFFTLTKLRRESMRLDRHIQYEHSCNVKCQPRILNHNHTIDVEFEVETIALNRASARRLQPSQLFHKDGSPFLLANGNDDE